MPYLLSENKKIADAAYRQRFWYEFQMYDALRRLAFGGQIRKKDRVRYNKRDKAKTNAQRRANYKYDSAPFRARVLRWLAKHPNYSAARNAIRRSKTKIKFTQTRRAIEKIYARARELRQWFDVVVDHIIPLAKGGLHHPDNLQIIYRYENSRKAARLDFQPTVVFT